MQTTQPLAIEIPVDSPAMGRAVERAAIKFAALYRERHAAQFGKLIDRATEFYLELVPIPLEDDPQVERNGRARAQFLLEDRPYTAAQASKALGSRARNRHRACQPAQAGRAPVHGARWHHRKVSAVPV